MKFRETLAKLGRGTKIGLGIITILTVGFMAFWETQKAGFHEDEAYTISSSVSPVWDELMATADENGAPKFRHTKVMRVSRVLIRRWSTIIKRETCIRRCTI